MHSILHTLDGGNTWDIVSPASASAVAFDVTSTHVIAGISPGGISRYDGAAGTWEPSQTDAAPQLTHITFTGRDRGYALVGDALLATSDGGRTWAEQRRGVKDMVAAAGTVWVAGLDGRLYRSDDGQPWRDVPLPPGADQSAGLFLQAAAGDRVWLALEGGLWRGDRGGAAWRKIDSFDGGKYNALDVYRAWVTSPCVPGHCVLRVTADGGDTWTTRPDLPDTWRLAFIPTAPLAAGEPTAGGGGPGCPCETTTRDDGQTWQRVSTAPWALDSWIFLDEQHGWATSFYQTGPTYHPVILSTNDGGGTWSQELEFKGSVHTPFRYDDVTGLRIAKGRLWLPVLDIPKDTDCCSDIMRDMSPYARVIIYRRDITPDAPADATPAHASRGRGRTIAAAAAAGAVLLLGAAALVVRTRRRGRQPEG